MAESEKDAESTIIVEHRGPVGLVTLNRPGNLNAFTQPMQDLYAQTLWELNADPAVRVVVVTGAGRGFCSGGDVSILSSGELASYDPAIDLLPTVALEVRKPIVAAVNGPVAGIGFAVMMASDVRFVAAQARIGTSFSRLGLVAEYGLSWLLPRIIGVGPAVELLMSGRVVDADEALRLGLVQEVVSGRPVLDRALEWALDVAEHCSPRSLAAIKQQVYGDLDRNWPHALSRAVGLMRESFGWDDLPEALAARKEGRSPGFAPLQDGQALANAGKSREVVADGMAKDTDLGRLGHLGHLGLLARRGGRAVPCAVAGERVKRQEQQPPRGRRGRRIREPRELLVEEQEEQEVLRPAVGPHVSLGFGAAHQFLEDAQGVLPPAVYLFVMPGGDRAQRSEVIDLVDLLGEHPLEELRQARPGALAAERAGQRPFVALKVAKDNPDEQAAPVGEVPVQGRAAQARSFRDVVKRDVQAAFGEQLPGGLQQRLPVPLLVGAGAALPTGLLRR
jgi:enoyl-CoA hydratase/carnithine racemase